MSHAASYAAWEVADLDAWERLLLLALADHCNLDGKCWPSQARLSCRTGISERKIRDLMLALARKGLITRQHRKTATGRDTDAITLTFLPAQRAATLPAPERRGSGRRASNLPAQRAAKPVIEPEKNLARARLPLISGALGSIEEQRAALLADPLNKANWKTDG